MDLDLDGLLITPDISVYPKMRIDFTRDTLRMTKPPLTAFWIENPTESTQRMLDRIRDLLAAGVPSCWLVQPAMQTITVYTTASEPKTFSKGTLTDPVTDIELVVEDVFSNA